MRVGAYIVSLYALCMVLERSDQKRYEPYDNQIWRIKRHSDNILNKYMKF